MLQIRHSGGAGYTISTGDRKRGGYHARDTQELQEAVGHYFGDIPAPHHGKREGCPLCRAMQQEAR